MEPASQPFPLILRASLLLLQVVVQEDGTVVEEQPEPDTTEQELMDANLPLSFGEPFWLADPAAGWYVSYCILAH